jgi:hypothetical protein
MKNLELYYMNLQKLASVRFSGRVRDSRYCLTLERHMLAALAQRFCGMSVAASELSSEVSSVMNAEVEV